MWSTSQLQALPVQLQQAPTAASTPPYVPPMSPQPPLHLHLLTSWSKLAPPQTSVHSPWQPSSSQPPLSQASFVSPTPPSIRLIWVRQHSHLKHHCLCFHQHQHLQLFSSRSHHQHGHIYSSSETSGYAAVSAIIVHMWALADSVSTSREYNSDSGRCIHGYYLSSMLEVMIMRNHNFMNFFLIIYQRYFLLRVCWPSLLLTVCLTVLIPTQLIVRIQSTTQWWSNWHDNEKPLISFIFWIWLSWACRFCVITAGGIFRSVVVHRPTEFNKLGRDY